MEINSDLICLMKFKRERVRKYLTLAESVIKMDQVLRGRGNFSEYNKSLE